MSSTSERVRALVEELQQLDVKLWLDERGAHAGPKEKLTAEVREELRSLKSEILEYLAEQGESIVDPDAPVLNNTPPRTPEEVDQQRADADRERRRARRRYQGGTVVINDRNNFGRYMDLLVKEKERREAVARGDLPQQGRSQTKFDVFN